MKTLRLTAAALALWTVLPGANPAVLAQGQGTSGSTAQTRPIGQEEFLRLAYSSASLQSRAAMLAASRETRPEVKGYATGAAEFRKGLLQRIEAFAKERGMTLPSVKEFEHQVIIENLEPLDYLALSRRYAEIQVQALVQELQIYEAASRGDSAEIKSFAEQVLPELQAQREGAEKMYEAVRP